MGSSTSEAKLVARSLVDANLMGHDSHGITLIPTYVDHFLDGLLIPNVSAELLGEDGPILRFSGNRGFGRHVGGEAMVAAIERCTHHGVVLMTLCNAHHLGRIGAYAEIALAAGLVSIHFVNVVDHRPMVAPWGGTQGRFVTNPICIGVPGTDNSPATLLDMATSKIALGKARVAMDRGEDVGEGAIIDSDGCSSTDPGVIFDDPPGALLPFGQYKGSGLALICELLAGCLSGGGTIQPGNRRRGSIVNNMMTMLVDPVRLVDQKWLAREIDSLVAFVRSSDPIDSVQPVLLAGEPELLKRRHRRSRGIRIDRPEWSALMESGRKLGLNGEELFAVGR